MRSKTLLVGVIGVVIGVLLVATGIVVAGSLNPSAGPTEAGSQMYTLEQIYTRLSGGGDATKMAAFTEPGSGPTAGTMHTLDELYALALPARVPKTGQTQCYDASTTVIDCAGTGQDGASQKGVAWPNPRFTDHGNGTVTDNLTGLIWLKNASCANVQRDWVAALSDVASLNAGGTMNSNNCGDTSNGGGHQTDWRLANVREMLSLVDYGRRSPYLPSGHPFTGVQNAYWTSSPFVSNAYFPWWVTTWGTVSTAEQTTGFYAWPVRGGQ